MRLTGADGLTGLKRGERTCKKRIGRGAETKLLAEAALAAVAVAAAVVPVIGESAACDQS